MRISDFIDPVTYTPPTLSDAWALTERAARGLCEDCKFWKPEPDGMAGECINPDFCDMVWSRWDALSPILTKAGFHCDYWEQGWEE